MVTLLSTGLASHTLLQPGSSSASSTQLPSTSVMTTRPNHLLAATAWQWRRTTLPCVKTQKKLRSLESKRL